MEWRRTRVQRPCGVTRIARSKAPPRPVHDVVGTSFGAEESRANLADQPEDRVLHVLRRFRLFLGLPQLSAVLCVKVDQDRCGCDEVASDGYKKSNRWRVALRSAHVLVRRIGEDLRGRTRGKWDALSMQGRLRFVRLLRGFGHRGQAGFRGAPRRLSP